MIRICRTVFYVALTAFMLVLPLPSASPARAENRPIKAGVLKNWPPHYTTNKTSGTPSGFAVELFDEIARKAGLSVQYVAFDTWPMVHEALEKKQIDVVPNMGITRDRMRRYDFTPPVEAFDIHIFIRETTHDIRGLKDLKGRRVGVVKQNEGLSLMEEFGQSELEVYNALDTVFIALISARVDALVYPEPNVLMVASQAGLENRIKTAGRPLLEVKRAVAVSKGQPELLNRLTPAVESFVSTPGYQTIYRKYFRKPEPYWNAKKIFVIMSVLLLSTTILLLFWRYLSMVKINSTLAETVRLKTKAEEKQLKQQGFLAKAQEIGKIGTWELDLKKNELVWTEENYRIFGLPDGTPLTYETFLSCVHPEDRTFVHTEWTSSLEGKPYDIEHRLLVAGRVKWVREKAELAFDESGKCISGIGVTQDITERKKTERDLEKSEAWHRSIIQTAMDGFWITDNAGNLLEVNNTYCQMSGYTQDELLKMNISDLESLEKRGDTAAHIRLVRQRGEDRFQSRHQRKDGRRIDVEISVQYRGEDEDRFVVFVKDITERTRWQERLQQAQKMESIGNLAGGIAHDFNNILFPIIGMSEMLIEDLPLRSPERENAQEIYRAGRRGGELVKQILAFSRQSEHVMSPTRVQHILKEVLKLSRATIPSSIDICREIQPDCGLILGDPTQIHQVAMNIITNAYHAIGDSGGTITIRLNEKNLDGTDLFNSGLPPGRYAVLSVSDTGHGITAEHIEKIFDPYFTTKEQGKGTGLGLAVVHGIVQAHNGDITVASRPGEGATFTVYLPLMNKSSVDAIDIEEKKIPLGRENILLVDDELAVARLEKLMLERLGYTVTMRVNSLEALEAFQAAPNAFDAVISDMTMPHMTGEELARKVKSLRSDIPIIICTGFSERIDERTLEQLGINGLLMKPILRTDLAAAVRRVLDDGGSTG